MPTTFDLAPMKITPYIHHTIYLNMSKSHYFSLKSFIGFCDNLTPLLKAGIPLYDSLIILTNPTQKKETSPIQTIMTQMEMGKTFITALSSVFPKHIPFHLGLADTIPDTGAFLSALSHYYTQKQTHLQKLKQQLFYPSFLMVSLLGITVFMMTFMLPNFIQFYDTMALSPPRLLLSLMSFKLWFSSSYMSLLFALIILGIRFKKSIIQVFYGIIFPYRTSDILWLLSLFLKSGISLKAALEMFAFPLTHPLHNPYSNFKNDCLTTGQFSLALSTHLNLPPYHRELLSFSEKTSALHDGLSHISNLLYEEERKRFAGIITTIQPLLLIVISTWIGASLYFSFLPVLSGLQAFQ